MNNGSTYLRLVAVACFWGACFNAGALALRAMPPLTVTAWRFIIASVLMLLLFFSKERPTWQRVRSSIWAYILLGIVGVSVTNVLQFTALEHTSPIHPALIMATNPIVTAILAALLLREKLRARQAMGMLLSVIGVLFVITKGSFLQLTSVSIGDVMAMGANISWALYGVLGRKFLKASTPLATSTMTMLVAALCMLPFVSVQHAEVSNTVLITAWLSIAFLGSFGSVLTFIWWNQGIATVGASKTSVFFNLVPVVTVIISAIMGEPVGWIQIVGTFFVIMGVVIATLTVREQQGTTSMAE